MIKFSAAILCGAILFGSPLWAGVVEQRIAKAIEGCEAYLTVQARQCKVEQTYQCGTDGFVQVLYEQNKPTGIEYIGPLGGPGHFFDLQETGGVRVHNGDPGFSIEALRSLGTSGEKLTVDVLMGGFDGQGLATSIEATLSDEIEIISGIRFRKGQFAMAISMPAEIGALINVVDIRVADNIGVVLTGSSMTTIGDTTIEHPDDIKQIFRPGDDGFMVNQGLYECGELG